MRVEVTTKASYSNKLNKITFGCIMDSEGFNSLVDSLTNLIKNIPYTGIEEITIKVFVK